MAKKKQGKARGKGEGGKKGAASSRDRLRRKQQAAMLDAIRAGCTIQKAIKGVGIGENTHYRWVEKYEDYREAVLAAKIGRIHRLRDSLFKSALGGNVTAAIFLICNEDPDNYQSVNKLHVGGPNGENLSVVLKRLEQAAEEKQGGSPPPSSPPVQG